MKNILSIDVEDWFHILDIEGAPTMDRWDGLERRVDRNFSTLLDLFLERRIRVTCFFVGWVAERCPHLVRRAAKEGHEVASHSYAHELVYRQSREQFRRDVRTSKSILEDLSGEAVAGYRAPGFSIVPETPWALEELASAGYRYDSSIFPAARGHGGWAGQRVEPHEVRTGSGPIHEFPVTVYPVLGRRICFFGGGYFRFFPYPIVRSLSQQVNRGNQPVVYYLHPREIDPRHPRIPMGLARRFKSYFNLHSTRRKLNSLLRDFELCSFRDWMAEHR